MSPEQTVSCQQCGASIYREHLDSGIARYEGGKLLCSFCVNEYESSHDNAGSDMLKLDDEPIAFDSGGDEREMSSTNIRAFGAAESGVSSTIKFDDSKFNRSLQPDAGNATRCRVFHSKLNEGAIAFMSDQVNAWIDSRPDITIKFAQTTIGVFEGKQKDQNLIVTIFY